MRLRLVLDRRSGLAVSGSTGYIGSSVQAAALKAQFEPVEALSALPSGVVLVHLAAGIAAPGTDVLIGNLEMDRAVFEWANGSGAAGVVYASTNNVYGKALDCRTGDPLRAVDDYSASKAFGEMMIRDQLTCPWIILRIGDVFGRGQRHGNLFRAAEAAIRDGKSLRQFGEGMKLRSYIYIKELVSQILYAADGLRSAPSRAIYNIAHQEPLTVRELLRRLGAIAALEVEKKNATGDSSHLDLRTMSVEPMPGYEPAFTMQSALADYVREVKGSR